MPSVYAGKQGFCGLPLALREGVRQNDLSGETDTDEARQKQETHNMKITNDTPKTETLSLTLPDSTIIALLTDKVKELEAALATSSPRASRDSA